VCTQVLTEDIHVLILTRRSKFCVSVSGFKAAGTLSAEIFGTSYSTPTLHVLGGTDVIVIPERSKVLLDISQNKRVEEHEGGQLVLLCGCVSFLIPVTFLQVILCRRRRNGGAYFLITCSIHLGGYRRWLLLRLPSMGILKQAFLVINCNRINYLIDALSSFHCPKQWVLIESCRSGVLSVCATVNCDCVTL